MVHRYLDESGCYVPVVREVVLCYGRRTFQKATAACRAQVKCETYYLICYRCPWRRRHFSSRGTRNQAETTKGNLQQKLNTLRQLAAEILAIVAEEEIEGETEQAVGYC